MVSLALTSQLNLGWGSFMLPQDDHKTGELLDFPDGPVVHNPPSVQGTHVQFLVQEDITC